MPHSCSGFHLKANFIRLPAESSSVVPPLVSDGFPNICLGAMDTWDVSLFWCPFIRSDNGSPYSLPLSLESPSLPNTLRDFGGSVSDKTLPSRSQGKYLTEPWSVIIPHLLRQQWPILYSRPQNWVPIIIWQACENRFTFLIPLA